MKHSVAVNSVVVQVLKRMRRLSLCLMLIVLLTLLYTQLRLQTMQHAIIAQLRNPPLGTRALIAAYARTRAAALRRLAATWLTQATPATRGAMQRACDELDDVLVQLLR